MSGKEDLASAVADLLAMWRRQPDLPLACPACQEPMVVTDRSTRPYAEWFNFHCDACGFDHTLHIPLAGPAQW